MPDAPSIRWPRIAFTLGCLALPLGLAHAFSTRWHCDDAFISFRYAEHLVRGQGLVFNPGERVEGYTNFLWTIWIALGLRLGADAEHWSIASSLACHAATILILLLLHLRWRRSALAATPLPLAALVAALHPDWNIYATGGLETALFILLSVAAFALLTAPAPRNLHTMGAAALLALACLTRPDGLIFAALGGAHVMCMYTPRLRHTLLFAAVLLVILVPFQLWRVRYYGDWFPNTYYAKSADRAWWSQGWIYTRLYYQRYWVLLLAPLLFLLLAPFALLIAVKRGRSHTSHIRHRTSDIVPFHIPSAPFVLALLFAAAYSLYVMRVGGDFMYARLLIPTAPFLAIALEIGLLRLPLRHALMQPLLALLLLAAVNTAPAPLDTPDPAAMRRTATGLNEISGIVDEWRFYSGERSEDGRQRGLALRPFLEGLPVRLAFYGSEARMVYYSGVHTAIECDTGLTDAAIARQPLAARGRVGHEKRATLDYLLEQRRVHITFNDFAAGLLALDAAIPRLSLICDGVAGRILHWDPPLMYALAERGAQVPDFEAILDDTLARLDEIPDDELARIYAKLRRFYFQFIPDPARQAPFRARLAAD